MSDFIYPFDPTGNAPSNLILNERQTISPPNWTDFYFVIPKMAPYFKDSLRVIHRPSGRILVEGQDYHCTHFFRDASLRTANRIYGSITLLDKTLTGLLEMNYQTLGGDWVLDENKILEILSDVQLNPRITTWEQVADAPYAFPPIDHEWDLQDLKGMEDVVAELDAIAAAIRESSGSDFSIHINNKDNPHEVTKAQVGLSFVQNYPMATTGEATAAESNARYMTPLRVKQLVDAVHLPVITDHINKTDNPHFVTKAQVGLGNVDNFQTATKPEAEAGTSNASFMTPLRVKEAIDVLALAPLTNHIGNTTNPHNVTKQQVGLGSVEDFGVATRFEAEAGIANDRYMTPLRTSQAINYLLKDSLDTHINATNNPHSVTADQVGLGNVGNYPVASTQEAKDGLRNDRYMTPLRVAEVISDIVAGDFGFHLNDTTNPHNVTAAQVNAYSKTEIDNLLISKLGVSETASNSFLLGGYSSEYYLELIDGLKTDLTSFSYQYTVNQLRAIPPFDDGGTIVPGQFLGNSWTKLALVRKPVGDTVSKLLQLFLSGYDSESNNSNSCFMTVDVKNNTGVVQILTGTNPVSFYIRQISKSVVIDEEENISEMQDFLEIWIRQFGSRGQINVTVLSSFSDFEAVVDHDSVETQPTDLIELGLERLIKNTDVQIINGGTF